MKKKKSIYITEDDMQKLRGLIERRGFIGSEDRDYLSALEEELDRAEIVERGEMPRDVITMGSEVELQDLDSKQQLHYKLVFPAETRKNQNAISVLAPIGTALLGYRVGDVIEWTVPKGVRRLKVLRLIYQPETQHVPA